MNQNFKIWLLRSSLIAVSIACIVYIVLVFLLPDTTPIHFNSAMIVDAVGSPLFLLAFGFIPLALSLAVFVDTFVKLYGKNTKIVYICLIGVALFLMYLGWIFYGIFNSDLQLGDKANVSMSILVMLPLALIMIVFGNYIPQIKQNRTMGYKLPWTLQNEVVWQKTHRFAGIVTVLAGIMLAISAVICGLKHDDVWIFLPFGVAFLSITVLPIIYAKICFENEKKLHSTIENQENNIKNQGN